MSNPLVHGIVYSLLFSLIGVLVLGGAFFLICKLVPFSVRKEIEEDQNTSLGIIMGAVILGLSIIIASAMH